MVTENIFISPTTMRSHDLVLCNKRRLDNISLKLKIAKVKVALLSSQLNISLKNFNNDIADH